jgi:hypothetical protein
MTIIARTSYVLPLTTIFRRRQLPLPGRILVRQGQKVMPNDVIAEASLPSGHLILDVARGLGVPPLKADQLIDRAPGDHISAGDLIAARPGMFFSRTMRTPVDGKIVSVRNGKVLVQQSEASLELKAAYAGTVSEVIPERGVILELSGALIQGVWGNGKAEFGVMQIAAQAQNTILKLDRIDVSLRGGILVGGHLAEAETLTSLAEIPIRGLILASMPSRLIKTALSMPYPILLTEGFGKLPMNLPAFRLLATNAGREVSLTASHFQAHQGIVPEVLIPLPVTGKPQPPPAPRQLAPQNRVKIVWSPYSAQTGVIQSLSPEPVSFQAGLRYPAAQVKLDSGELAAVPMANLVVLEYK